MGSVGLYLAVFCCLKEHSPFLPARALPPESVHRVLMMHRCHAALFAGGKLVSAEVPEKDLGDLKISSSLPNTETFAPPGTPPPTFPPRLPALAFLSTLRWSQQG